MSNQTYIERSLMQNENFDLAQGFVEAHVVELNFPDRSGRLLPDEALAYIAQLRLFLNSVESAILRENEDAPR